ncbi:hypothetical protein, partial [Bacillus safensis]|uniref:hypothetical protein n=1 Tax=Bacillus safensis TaxID=561879 RepID=UPI001C2675D5
YLMEQHVIHSKHVKTRYLLRIAGFKNYPSVLIMLEIESNNWLSTSENIFLPPLFSFYIYLTKGMKGWITFSKKTLKKMVA